MLRKKTNLRGICWYLTQIIHYNGELSKSTYLISSIKSSKLSEKIDVKMIKKQLLRMYGDATSPNMNQSDISNSEANYDSYINKTKIESYEKEYEESYFSRDFQIIIPEFSDDSCCHKFLEEFKSKEPNTFIRLLKALKRFSKLLTISHTKKLYYPVYLLNVLEDWISRNFGLIEIEFQINIIRMIVGNLEDNKILIYILMLEQFSSAERDNNFLQLFINSCTIDVNCGSNT